MATLLLKIPERVAQAAQVHNAKQVAMLVRRNVVAIMLVTTHAVVIPAVAAQVRAVLVQVVAQVWAARAQAVQALELAALHNAMIIAPELALIVTS